MRNVIPEPWGDFLRELDSSLDKELSLVCIGGFVLAMLYGLVRPTSDLDFIECEPKTEGKRLLEIAGEGSRLHQKHGLFLQRVSVAQLPDAWEGRLAALFEGEFRHLRLFALGPYDLALSKLERNSEKDRDDVLRLATSADFDPQELKRIYEEEFRTYVEDRLLHRTTFEFWMELINEQAAGNEEDDHR